jgi:hypothetical protein
MWEVWIEENQYFQGKLLKRTKTKETAITFIKKEIKHKKISKTENSKEFIIEAENSYPIGILINNSKEKKE